MDTQPRAGQLLHITRAASVQFINPFLFRVIRCLDRPTYHGWAWIDGYELDDRGDASRRRELFVQLAGLRPAPEPPHPRNGNAKHHTTAVGQANRRTSASTRRAASNQRSVPRPRAVPAVER